MPAGDIIIMCVKREKTAHANSTAAADIFL
jgi:hypothetical protein